MMFAEIFRDRHSGLHNPATTRRIAWCVLLIADIGVLLYGILLAFFPVSLLEAGIERYTRESWPSLQATTPNLADYLVLLARLLGAFNIAFGILGGAVAATAFRRGHRWAWWALLAGNAAAYGSSVAWDISVGAISFYEVIEILLAAAVALVMALTAREFLANQTPVTGRGV